MTDFVVDELSTKRLLPPPNDERSARSAALPLPLPAVAGTLPELDGLRGIAILLTIAYHLELYLPRVAGAGRGAIWLRSDGKVLTAFGATGVHLFFVLSGFLLFRPYARALVCGAPFPDTRRFFVRRALRILPAYWASLAIVVLFWKRAYLSPPNRGNLILHVFLAHNWSQTTIEAINPPFWTMAVETQFYLLLPVCGAALFELHRTRSKTTLACLLSAIALSPWVYTVASTALTRSGFALHTSALYALGYLSVFASGCLGSLFLVALETGSLPELLRAKSGQLAKLAGLLGVALLAIHFSLDHFGASLMNERGHRYWLIGMPLLGLGYGGLLLGVVNGFPAWKRACSVRPLRFLGVISYSLYLWNVPLLVLIVLPLALRLRSPVAILAAAGFWICATMVPICYLSFLLTERPFFALRRRKRERAT